MSTGTALVLVAVAWFWGGMPMAATVAYFGLVQITRTVVGYWLAGAVVCLGLLALGTLR